MIDLVEVRGTNREIIGIVDDFKSLIWHTVWYGVGDFEIYAKATSNNLTMLQNNKYVTRADSDEIGIIESVTISTSAIDGNMITASGRFAKSILDRRLIYNLSGTTNRATVLTGSVESAARALVASNCIACIFDTSRNFTILELGTLKYLPEIIVDENGNASSKQVSYQNLLEYTDGLLEEYQLSARVTLNTTNMNLQYNVLKGADRSSDNTDGNEPVVFSKEFDNLSASNYLYNTSTNKNVALIGGAGEDLDRFYALLKRSHTGLNRKEIFVDARSISKKYQDENEQEQEYTDAEYTKMLKLQGMQELAPLTITEEFSGTILVTSGNYILNTDFKLGDIVTVQENSIDKYINVRIIEVTEVQDENGYTVDAVYG